MRISAELGDYEAAGSLAEELPYWGWLEDGRTCLTGTGELIAAGRPAPAVVDGRSPEQIDRVLGRWQRLLSGLDADTRLYFYLLRRPASPEAADDESSGIVAVSQRKRRVFLSSRVQQLEAYLVWSHDPRLRAVADGPGIAAATAPASGQQASRPAPGPVQPGRSVRPADPPGWERIHEGSFLEAVLLTQLTGEFPGPVLAMVSVPFYSADRQRVLIPRGARVVGTAQAVQDPDQSRLAVAFHRLIMPDGSWIDLEFTGLNQAGEGALQDQVDRHYFSTFAAAGAVGVVSGLALAGGSPFGLRAGVGQGLGQSATSVLDRFLNRLPTITIRAGHRLRIWFTSDVLVPRAGTRQ